MPSKLVFDKFKAGQLHSGSKSGPVVKNRKQAIAIYMHEKENEDATGSAESFKPIKRPVRHKRGA